MKYRNRLAKLERRRDGYKRLVKPAAGAYHRPGSQRR